MKSGFPRHRPAGAAATPRAAAASCGEALERTRGAVSQQNQALHESLIPSELPGNRDPRQDLLDRAGCSADTPPRRSGQSWLMAVQPTSVIGVHGFRHRQPWTGQITPKIPCQLPPKVTREVRRRVSAGWLARRPIDGPLADTRPPRTPAGPIRAVHTPASPSARSSSAKYSPPLVAGVGAHRGRVISCQRPPLRLRLLPLAWPGEVSPM